MVQMQLENIVKIKLLQKEIISPRKKILKEFISQSEYTVFQSRMAAIKSSLLHFTLLSADISEICISTSKLLPIFIWIKERNCSKVSRLRSLLFCSRERAHIINPLRRKQIITSPRGDYNQLLAQNRIKCASSERSNFHASAKTPLAIQRSVLLASH